MIGRRNIPGRGFGSVLVGEFEEVFSFREVSDCEVEVGAGASASGCHAAPHRAGFRAAIVVQM